MVEVNDALALTPLDTSNRADVFSPDSLRDLLSGCCVTHFSPHNRLCQSSGPGVDPRNLWWRRRWWCRDAHLRNRSCLPERRAAYTSASLPTGH